MAMNTIGLAFGMVEAERRGLPRSESVRIGAVASLLGSPLISLVIARNMAERKVAELAPRLSTADPVPSHDHPGGGDVPGGTPGGTPGDQPGSGVTLEQVGAAVAITAERAALAHEAAVAAQTAATEAKAEVAHVHEGLHTLKADVAQGFKQVLDRLPAPATSTVAALGRGRAKGEPEEAPPTG